jgi:hypothetical protein
MNERETGFCRNGAMHYCPNCANTFKAAPSPEPPRPQEPPAPLRALVEDFRREVRDKLAVAHHAATNPMRGSRDVVLQQCEDFLVEQFESALRVGHAPTKEQP